MERRLLRILVEVLEEIIQGRGEEVRRPRRMLRRATATLEEGEIVGIVVGIQGGARVVVVMGEEVVEAVGVEGIRWARREDERLGEGR